MSAPTLYRIIEAHPYLDREEEWSGLTLKEAAQRLDELTGVGADLILSDFDEDCTCCEGRGYHRIPVAGFDCGTRKRPCNPCSSTGKRREPWEWVDEETGREVTLRLEVE